MRDLAALREQRRRNGHYFFMRGVGVGNEREFVIHAALGPGLGFALDEAHLRFAREHVGHELADEQQNDSRVGQVDAGGRGVARHGGGPLLGALVHSGHRGAAYR